MICTRIRPSGDQRPRLDDEPLRPGSNPERSFSDERPPLIFQLPSPSPDGALWFRGGEEAPATKSNTPGASNRLQTTRPYLMESDNLPRCPPRAQRRRHPHRTHHSKARRTTMAAASRSTPQPTWWLHSCSHSHGHLTVNRAHRGSIPVEVAALRQDPHR